MILAGGTGSRLKELTKGTNKHLLPINYKPMILYPIQTLANAGIKDILIITNRNHVEEFENILGSGVDLGIKLMYDIQEEAKGIAQALSLAENFVGEDNLTLILGDNIFQDNFEKDVSSFTSGAKFFLKEVTDANRFGVAELKDDKLIGIEEKPSAPKSNLAVTGLYIYCNEVFRVIKTLKFSARGELEITDVNKYFVNVGTVEYRILRGFWIDAGTKESLDEASQWYKNRKPF